MACVVVGRFQQQGFGRALPSAGFTYKSLRPVRCELKTMRSSSGFQSGATVTCRIVGKPTLTSSVRARRARCPGFPPTVRSKCCMRQSKPDRLEDVGTPPLASGPPTVPNCLPRSVEPRQQARLSRGRAIGKQPARRGRDIGTGSRAAGRESDRRRHREWLADRFKPLEVQTLGEQRLLAHEQRVIRRHEHARGIRVDHAPCVLRVQRPTYTPRTAAVPVTKNRKCRPSGRNWG